MNKAYQRENGGFILIEDKVIKELFSFKQGNCTDHESGGILLGNYRGIHIEITSLTRPMKNDISSRNRFIRQDPNHNKLAYQKWKDSYKYNTYIGEWHTHPENIPSPSFIDIREWKAKLPKRNMVLIIQGIKQYWIAEYVFKKRTISVLNEV